MKGRQDDCIASDVAMTSPSRMISPPAGGAASALRRADADSERLAAVIRLAILSAIAGAVIVAESAGFSHRPLVVATMAYGAATVLGLALAWRRVYRPWLPYAFVALDVATLALALLMLGRLLDLHPSQTMALPVAGLVIVVLLHASMHHRAALVAFGAAVFAASLLGGALMTGVLTPPSAAGLHDHAVDHLAHFRYFPVAIFILTAVILLITTRRTRRFIEEAFAQATRAAELSRYFAPEVVDELTRRAGGAASFGDRIEVAVLFADLRGFTAMSEAMDPAELARFLSEFRARIARPAIDNGGVVDKYIGDAIMVVFGVPRPGTDDARRALRCAAAMAQAIRAWSDERERQGKPPVRVGIGGHYGQAFAGVLSDGRLLEYTVIGDTVNIASRLADVTEREQTGIAVSAELVSAAGGLPDARGWSAESEQRVPGHPKVIRVFRWR